MRAETELSASGPRRREEVLAAAAECFMRRGYENTSMDDVAQALGATKGRVYHHFNSKPDLYFAVHRRAMSMLTERVTPFAISAGSAAERLAGMAEAHALCLMESLPFQRTVALAPNLWRFGRAAEHATELSELIAIRDEYEAQFRRVLTAGLADGSLQFEDVAIASRSLLGALNWVAVWYEPRPGDTLARRRALARSVARTVIEGYGTRARPQRRTAASVCD